jgi:type III pantothenate kinase
MNDPCLQLDVGNSGAKWRLLAAGKVLARGTYRTGDDESRRQLLACSPVVGRIWVASVAAPEAEQALADLLRERWSVEPWFARTPARTGDLRNSYREPARLGIDRWLAMLGARRRRDGRVCVVDAGSALTIDIIAADGRHEGGYIIPGAALMERALLLDTGRVRFAEETPYGLAPGVSTAEAVRHGISASLAGAVELVLRREALDSGQLLLCGGAGQVLQELLQGAGEYIADLVFEGLEVMADRGAAN